MRRFRRYQMAIRTRKSKDRKHNGKKRRKTDLQNTTQKTKDRVTRTRLKTGVSSGAPDG
jgi:hypothetical protein